MSHLIYHNPFFVLQLAYTTSFKQTFNTIKYLLFNCFYYLTCFI